MQQDKHLSLFHSKLIIGTKPNLETMIEIQEKMNIPAGTFISLLVFEASFKDKKIYICFSGGERNNGNPHFTLIGRASMEALYNLPLGKNDRFTFRELKPRHMHMREKIRSAIKRAPIGSKICFFGDMPNKLNEDMLRALNVIQGPINIAHRLDG